MKNELFEYKVIDRQSFANFLELLRHDFVANSNDWGNNNINDFLEAMSRYVEDIQGYYDSTNQNINADIASWKVFADIFQGSKIYE